MRGLLGVEVDKDRLALVGDSLLERLPITRPTGQALVVMVPDTE